MKGGLPFLSAFYNHKGKDTLSKPAVTQGSSTAPFRYDPIDNEEQIRLISVKQGAEDAATEIKIEVTTHARSTAPPYEALSYAWGDVSAKVEIKCNGHALHISRSCADALRAISSWDQRKSQTRESATISSLDDRESRSQTSAAVNTFWIDAICIDQNNIKERNAQVAKMGQLYANAEATLVYLGEPDEDFEYMRHILLKLEQAFAPVDNSRNALDECLDLIYRMDSASSPKPNTWHRMAASTLSRDDLQLPYEEILERRLLLRQRFEKNRGRSASGDPHWTSFFGRPWFRRTWIIQEVLKARAVRILVGPEETSWRAIVGCRQLLADYQYRAGRYDSRRQRSLQVPSLLGVYTAVALLTQSRVYDHLDPSINPEVMEDSGMHKQGSTVLGSMERLDDKAYYACLLGEPAIWTDYQQEAAATRAIRPSGSHGDPESPYVKFPHPGPESYADKVLQRLGRGLPGQYHKGLDTSRLLDMLIWTAGFRCRDPRDKLYAVLPLFQQPIAALLVPDYAKTVEEVYTDLSWFFLQSGDGPQILDLVVRNHSGPSLPSWVVDWRFPVPLEPSRNMRYQRASGFALERRWWVNPRREGTCLIITGARISTAASTRYDVICAFPPFNRTFLLKQFRDGYKLVHDFDVQNVVTYRAAEAKMMDRLGMEFRIY